MAHKKGTGSTRNGRDSNSKRLGVKRYGGETVSEFRQYQARASQPQTHQHRHRLIPAQANR